ncbi:MAG: anti-sigma factor [Mariniblastus sp.]|nr:anti-sigma factor [Mariniblastus sp.]
MNSSSSNEQGWDLLIGRAISGLSPTEESLLATFPSSAELENDRSFDLTVARIDVALGERERAELPGHLYAQVMADAQQRFSSPPVAKHSTSNRHPSSADGAMGVREVVAWMALAASIALACFLWLNTGGSPAPLTVAQLERVPDLKRVELQPTGDPLSGSIESAEILWSDSMQQGIARYRGLPVNDPGLEQYQLWIIDRERGFQQRVDGGVFDIARTSQLPGNNGPTEASVAVVTIPIRAKLKISDAKGFAVTREPPGGVVVSDLKRVVLISENAGD